MVDISKIIKLASSSSYTQSVSLLNSTGQIKNSNTVIFRKDTNARSFADNGKLFKIMRYKQ